LEASTSYTVLKTQRYERKFPVSNTTHFQLGSLIQNHPKLFSEIYHERWINNIYFDTPSFDFFQDNQSGKSDRKKVRIRWYGKLLGLIENPILEVKIKNGLAGSKKSYVLPPFSINGEGNLKPIRNLFEKADLPDEINLLVNSLKPTLINRYRRKYFLDYSKNFRLTLDHQMSYFDVQSSIVKLNGEIKHRGRNVLELKYELRHDQLAPYYTSYFPFRMNKHSKYVNGIEEFQTVAH